MPSRDKIPVSRHPPFDAPLASPPPPSVADEHAHAPQPTRPRPLTVRKPSQSGMFRARRTPAESFRNRAPLHSQDTCKHTQGRRRQAVASLHVQERMLFNRGWCTGALNIYHTLRPKRFHVQQMYHEPARNLDDVHTMAAPRPEQRPQGARPRQSLPHARSQTNFRTTQDNTVHTISGIGSSTGGHWQ